MLQLRPWRGGLPGPEPEHLRELLQSRQLKVISNNLEKKIRSELERMLKDDREGYEKFYRSFGRQLKLSALEQLRRHEGRSCRICCCSLLHPEEAGDAG